MSIPVSVSFFTSPRLRGEVGLRARASKSGEGLLFCTDAPHPSRSLAARHPLPVRTGRGKKEVVE